MKISTKYPVVIPREIRLRAGIRAGQQVEVLAKDRVITMIPLRPLGELRGILAGADMGDLRDKSDIAQG